MKGSFETSGGDESARAAADWLVKLEDAALSDADVQSWLAWLGATEANRRAFDELHLLRRQLRNLSEPRRRLLVDRARRRRAATDVPGERLAGSSPARVPARRVFLAVAASLAVAVALGIWLSPAPVNTTTYAAASDQHRTVALSDGSSLVMEAHAVVDVTFSPERRSLLVHQGKAYFEVQPDATRPFVVAAANVEVAAVGTAFSVEREADRVMVTVTHGRVRVTNAVTRAVTVLRGRTPTQASTINGASAALDLELSQGQQTQVALPAARSVVASASPTPAQRWIDGRAEFLRVPLREVLPVVNEYAPIPLVIDDPRVGDLPFTGTIFRNHVDEWVASLPSVYPIEMVTLDNATVTLVTRHGQPRSQP